MFLTSSATRDTAMQPRTRWIGIRLTLYGTLLSRPGRVSRPYESALSVPRHKSRIVVQLLRTGQKRCHRGGAMPGRTRICVPSVERTQYDSREKQSKLGTQDSAPAIATCDPKSFRRKVSLVLFYHSSHHGVVSSYDCCYTFLIFRSDAEGTAQARESSGDGAAVSQHPATPLEPTEGRNSTVIIAPR